jgi:hypothetical protein
LSKLTDLQGLKEVLIEVFIDKGLCLCRVHFSRCTVRSKMYAKNSAVWS